MATKVKPSRLQVSWTPQVWQVPVYVDEDTFWWWTGGGNWDVAWPASSTDWDIVLFDWATGKLIKDSWVQLSSKLDTAALSNAAYWSGWDWDTTHTPTKDAVYDKINSMDTDIGNNTSAISTINWKIPSAATTSNQLADKNYVDDSINSVTAYYITKNAQWDQWATRAELFAATTFYSGWVVRVPTKNDYTIVLADEQHDNATTRYIYNNGWEYQYTVNETALTQAQLNALNSWITAAKVTTYDWYATDIANKQDELVSGVNIRTINWTSILWSWDITTPVWWDVYWPASSTDWNIVLFDWVTWKSIKDWSKSVSDFVQTSWNQTIAWTKTFSTSPVVPNKTTAAANTWTAIATEAQVYKKQDKLTTQTAYTSKWTATKVPTITTNTLGQVTGITETSIAFPVTSVWGSTGAVWLKTINWNSIVGTGNITVSSSTTTTCTLTSAGWSSKSQTVSATGVTASNTVIVSPAPDDIADYADCGVYCSAQGSGTLTFGCDTAPSGDIVVNVLIMS